MSESGAVLFDYVPKLSHEVLLFNFDGTIN